MDPIHLHWRGPRQSKYREPLPRRDFATMSADEAGDTTPVSATNGEPHPDPATNATSGKRKRSTQDDKSSTDSSATTSRDQANLHETLRSLVELLLK